jgi:hypothetical protein
MYAHMLICKNEYIDFFKQILNRRMPFFWAEGMFVASPFCLSTYAHFVLALMQATHDLVLSYRVCQMSKYHVSTKDHNL